jgi:uncharacterized protein (DUF433 family)
MELLDRITIEPGKRGGRPCVRGLRVTVTDVLELLSNGLTSDQVVKQLPYLEPDDVRACLAYAARYLDHPRLVSA